MAAVETEATDQVTKVGGTATTDMAASTRLLTASRHVAATDQTKVTDHPATLATAAGVLSTRHPPRPPSGDVLDDLDKVYSRLESKNGVVQNISLSVSVCLSVCLSVSVSLSVCLLIICN